jgi:hypothetical protein
MASDGAGVTPGCAPRPGATAVACLAALALIALGALIAPARTSAEIVTTPNSADRLIFWTGCDEVVSLSDAELDEWKERGVDGFVCMGDRLRGLGGTQDFTGDPDADLSGANYELQRQLRDSRIVERAQARGMKLYLGVKLASYGNTATPLVDWFDDAGWSGQVLPRMRDLAAAASQLGFAGLAFDQELYAQRGGVETATWSWDYPGNTHTEAEVRAQARQRGEQLMATIVGAFPDVELAVYHFGFPGDWEELVQEQVNGVEAFSAEMLHIDFWDGMTSVEGYGAIRFWDNAFYKAPHRGTWDNALTYNQNRVYATLSRRFRNWDYASERVYVSPFSWVEPGPNASSAFDDARPPAYVSQQLLAFRKWGMGREFANYVSGSLGGFDYSPYVSGMQAASNPANVDGTDPTLRITSSAGSAAPPPVIQGTAHDNLAIRAVRWRDDRDGSGVAELTWNVLSGNYDAGYVWETRWSFRAAELTPGATRVIVTAEDLKGRTSPPGLLTWSSASDTTPPETSITAGASGVTGSTTAQFSFVSSEGGSSFRCRLDGGAWAACSSPRTYAGLAQGQHTFRVRATDAVGNVDPTPASRSFTVAQAARTRVIQRPPKRLRVTGRRAEVGFGFSGPDETVAYLCRLDGGSWHERHAETAAFEIRATRRWRKHTFEVTSIDSTGTETPPARYRFRLRRR